MEILVVEGCTDRALVGHDLTMAAVLLFISVGLQDTQLGGGGRERNGTGSREEEKDIEGGERGEGYGGGERGTEEGRGWRR